MPARSARKAAPVLSSITKSLLTTKEAATALSYSPSTLRHWANTGAGPIQPHRIGDATHLRWRTNDVRRLAGLSPLPEEAPPVDDTSRAEAAARLERDRGLRAELTTLRQSFARIEALVDPALPA
jgi:DNA-binding transcriptional MerR regulator